MFLKDSRFEIQDSSPRTPPFSTAEDAENAELLAKLRGCWVCRVGWDISLHPTPDPLHPLNWFFSVFSVLSG